MAVATEDDVQTKTQVRSNEGTFTPLHETDLGKALLDLVNQMERPEEYVRYRNVLRWRKHMHYWNNVQYLVQSTSARDWLTPQQIVEQDPQADIDPALYAKVVNIYRAHGEIIIGALSSSVPNVRFFPGDADDIDDINTAKACSKVAELIQRQNKARLLLMKILFIRYNQGLVAIYNEQKEDFRFGKLTVDEYEDVTAYERDHYCPNCGFGYGSETWQPGPPTETGPDQGPMMSEMQCPQCQMMGHPEYEDSQTTIQQKVGEKEEPKNREILEAYGPLNVKMPMWVRSQAQTPYLDLESEESVYQIKEIYSEIEELIEEVTYPDTLDREVRVPTLYTNDFPRGVCTVQRVWLRPMCYTKLRKDDVARQELEQNYPNGCYVVIINKKLVAEIVPDCLDDHWTISEDPLSEALHSEPLGAPLIPLQEITNELANLTLETIEFGLPETFADTLYLDFDSYESEEARPGQITPATVPAGSQLSQGFHTIKPATLSQEVELFADRIHTTSQFVMGTFPSVFGGAVESRGGTAKEYELSKSSALQRLSIIWTTTQELWARCMAKSVKSYIKHMREDEKFVKQQGENFLNVWIRQSELEGHIGDVEPEVSETFPISWSQKRDVILQLIEMQNEDIMTVIRHPENAGLIAQIIGVPELYIPGDDSRNKQLQEIAEMLMTEPTEDPSSVDMLGQPVPGQVHSSVQVDSELDDHVVEAETCKAWLISPVGQDAKKTNPAGYMNVLTHFKEHKMFEMQQQAAMMPQGGGPEDIADTAGSGESNAPQP